VFSKIVTISPLENSSVPKTDKTDDAALREIERVIDLLSDRIKSESAKL
jgi:hypothetical protein